MFMIIYFCMIMLQSETCEIIVPSLEFVSSAGLSSGRFTTLEGLLTNVKDQVGSFNISI